ncbi:MAG: diguanylate cyclase [Psychrosphaera sp.]|jgi:diguanylate cyclase|uniref:diguanylate cyclase n=1 Tax=Psychrosphaera aquimarina TaxID=2044854 RepID=A0ABU3QXP3_9GAMM|nr:GGDEF domain-containing protein [Psychrosphaera aquimarina]MDU0112177.1 GGDEF domain-containing protein [Psychrosphaera aquimarina]
MKYQDTIEQAESKLQKTLVFLKQHRLAASPINYSVAYEYASGENDDIVNCINKDINDGCIIDSFLMEELYRQFILSSDESSEKVVQHASSIINSTQRHTQKAQRDSGHYANILDEGLLLLNDSDPESSKQVIEKLIKATTYAKKTQQMLFKALQQAQTKSNELQQQIDDLHANRQLDALTGLYNRSVMSQTVDMWVNNDTKNIAALAINLDHFKQFNDNYGMTIGNVILSKVAQKVKSYVSDSGLPVRLAGEEFLVLIPDANPVTAKEIAEKVRVGVEKLQFINAKNKERLPKITVSIGVTEYCEKIGLDGTIQKATSALRMAKATGRNRVYTD